MLHWLDRTTCLVVLVAVGSIVAADEATWETVETIGMPTARHEAAFIAFENKAYLIGGRRINPVDVFDPTTKTWTALSPTPIELHHFQAVVVDDAIYLMGAMTGRYPRETPLEKVVVYYPKRDEFAFVHGIPESRRRGGAGAVYHDGRIYLVGGITNGHVDGYVPWLDAYDPVTGDWEILPDAPHARDHFQAAVVDGKLVAAAGRRTEQKKNATFRQTVEEVDVFEFEQGRWLPEPHTPAPIPTKRAGNMAMAYEGMLVIGGGESGDQKPAHDEVEVLDIQSGQWSDWPSLQRGRHGSGFAVIGDEVYIASGSGNRGGGPELTSLERLRLSTLPRKGTHKPVATSTSALWHPMEFSFQGPETSESATPNPFTHYQLDVTFRCGDDVRRIRGFYAADGRAADSGATSGGIWKARFTPDLVGTWSYQAELNLVVDRAVGDAIKGKREPVQLSGASGSFHVVPRPGRQDVSSRDFYERGFIRIKEGFFRFALNRGVWIKTGCGSPENLLAYSDFDGTSRVVRSEREGEAVAPEDVHRYQPHVRDWQEGDPIWANGRGKGLIGGINYLASQGVNSVYFLTLNLEGDGQDVWPYTSPNDFARFDCSKLEQWDRVFERMQRKGIALHMVLQETENERLLDDGDVGRLRRLYYQELIARFAHHPALIWNLGEENGPADFSPRGQTNEQQKHMADFFEKHDPYDHPVIIHTHATGKAKDKVTTGLVGHESLDGLSFQVHRPEEVHGEVRRWINKSKKAGHRWLIGMDEIGPWQDGVVTDSEDPDHDVIRRHVLWGSLLAGASGVDWYFGAKHPHNDLTSEDWREREAMWQQSAIARRFFESHLDLSKLKSDDERSDCPNDFCSVIENEACVIYLSGGETTRVRLPVTNKNSEGHAESWSVRWFDPKSGGPLQTGSIDSVAGADWVAVGQPPIDRHEAVVDQDWVVLLRSHGGQ
ncbi:MAG: DUF5060 domain-containing protein [Planctomycetota bacterium]